MTKGLRFISAATCDNVRGFAPSMPYRLIKTEAYRASMTAVNRRIPSNSSGVP